MPNADRGLHGLGKRGAVANAAGVEDREVCKHARLDYAAVVETDARSGERCEFANRVRERDHVAFAHVAAEDAWERAVCTRVRPLGCYRVTRTRIDADADPRLLHRM